MAEANKKNLGSPSNSNPSKAVVTTSTRAAVGKEDFSTPMGVDPSTSAVVTMCKHTVVAKSDGPTPPHSPKGRTGFHEISTYMIRRVKVSLSLQGIIRGIDLTYLSHLIHRP